MTLTLLSRACAIGLVAAAADTAQTAPDVIRLLSNDSGQGLSNIVFGNCGHTVDEGAHRALARKLVQLGPLAVPAIEAAMASIRKEGPSRHSPLAADGWCTHMP